MCDLPNPRADFLRGEHFRPPPLKLLAGGKNMSPPAGLY